MINVTQIDIELYSVVVEQLFCSFTIYYLISEKTFIKSDNLIKNKYSQNSVNNDDDIMFSELWFFSELKSFKNYDFFIHL